MESTATGYKLPDGMRIGERFLMHFDAPDLAREPRLGRLQDLRDDGSLCIDAPSDLKPPRGTPVTLSSVGSSPGAYRFSTEILGRGRLNGRLPVLLVRAPSQLERQQRRAAHRISAVLQARLEWRAPGDPRDIQGLPAVVTNLSGGGALIYVSSAPASRAVSLSLSVPERFVEEWAMRKLARLESRIKSPAVYREPLHHAAAQIQAGFAAIRGRVVRTSRCRRSSDQIVYAVSVAFAEPHDGCYRLVRYLERLAAQRGVEERPGTVAVAA